ncbi:alternative oxidase-domain-containing protein [Yarrowia lipolytica]|nr:alternative oxidase-domain-containing protein [Yarrowia lipolytica]
MTLLTTTSLLRTSRALAKVSVSVSRPTQFQHRFMATATSKEDYVKDPGDTKTLANTKMNDSSIYGADDSQKYETTPMWVHPIYTKEQMENLVVRHREAKTFSDKCALAAIRTMRWSFDLFTGYKHPKPGQENLKRFEMTPDKWYQRFLFLESIAGVPGMVGDAKPGYFMRTMILLGQGVFFNLFFMAYLMSPRICHRFVGYLEEEAVITYTRCITDIDAGRLPEWEGHKVKIPEIAIDYWHMGPNPTMRDLIEYIRADEAKHCEVNHTLGNLDQDHDRNPFALKIDNGHPQPSKDLSTYKGQGWSRDEIAN